MVVDPLSSHELVNVLSTKFSALANTAGKIIGKSHFASALFVIIASAKLRENVSTNALIEEIQINLIYIMRRDVQSTDESDDGRNGRGEWTEAAGHLRKQVSFDKVRSQSIITIITIKSINNKCSPQTTTCRNYFLTGDTGRYK